MPRARLSRWSRLLSSPIVRHPRLVLAACVALSLAALVPAMRIHIDSDLAALLPNGAPAADDYRVFLRTFGGFEKVFVLVRSPGRRLEDPGPLEDAAAALAGEMARSPEVADARSGRTEEDERFFYRYLAPRMPLLLTGSAEGAGPPVSAGGAVGEGDAADPLARSLTPAAILRRVEIMRQTLASPAGSALAPLYASDPLGLSEGLLAAASAAIPMDPLSGAFLSRRGDVALVMLTPAQAEIDPAGGRALLARLDAAYARVRAGTKVPLEFQAVGGPIYAAQDEGILRSDLARSGFSTVAGVAVVLLAGFEGLLLPAAILVAVLAGILWTAGVVGLAMPAMTVVGVGFAAALVGMGVDYGIHGGVQYRQLRLPEGGGAGMAAALEGAFRDTGPGVLTAALSTAACLTALASAHFRPLREIGKVLALGVLATLVATVTLSAALVAGAPGAAARPPARPRIWARRGLPGLRALARVAVRWPWAVVAAALALSAFGAWGLSRAALSTDLRALRPANAPSVAAEKLLVESFSLGIDTLSVVVRGRDLDQALDRAAAVAALLRRRLGAGAEIATPSDWLVLGARRERRLAELRRLPLARAAGDLERELTAAGFRREPFAPALAALRALARGEDPGAPPPGAWPSWMKELVRTGAGVPGVPPGGAAVAVHARLPLTGGGVPALPAELPRELALAAPGAALAAVSRVGAELKDLALADLLHSSAIALALVAAVVLVSFRGHLGRALLAFLPLSLGCLWTFGAWSACGRSFDLLAVFTVPLLVGTGINLGAHAVHWQRLYPHRGLAGAVEDIGLAMMMAAFTTALGFGSLVTSRVPGLAHDGVLVAAGITACLLATLLVLPALEELRARAVARHRGGGPDEARV